MRFYNPELSLENTYLHSGNIGAPLYQQAFRWFRKKYNVAFEIICDNDYGLGYIRGYIPYVASNNKSRTEPIYNNNDCFETYEQAELILLQKLIELCKQY